MENQGKNELDYFLESLDEVYSNQNDANGNKKENSKISEEIDGNLKTYQENQAEEEYYTEYYDPGSVMESFKKCECGSDVANLKKHSEWCPKFEQWMEEK